MKIRLLLAGWAIVIGGMGGLPAAAIGAGADAAVLHTIMRGVGDEEKDALWGYTKEVLGRYYKRSQNCLAV